MGVSQTQPQARNRILVCAATNIAVDTIAWKIKQGSIGPSGKVGDFKMSRFGSLPWDHVRDDGRDSVKVKRPHILSDMEKFLYAINVDRRASDGIQSHYHDDYDDDEEDDYKCWTPEGKKAKAPPKRKRRKRIVGRGTKRKEIIAESSVVVTTLSGAGSKAFIDAACRDPTRNDSEFDAVVIDEACVASESETLIPLKYNPTTVSMLRLVHPFVLWLGVPFQSSHSSTFFSLCYLDHASRGPLSTTCPLTCDESIKEKLIRTFTL